MRSTLVCTKLIKNYEEDSLYIDINDPEIDGNLKNVISEIKSFIMESAVNKKSFSLLYDKLMSPKYGIGMRKGVIPIFIAMVLHEYKQHAVVYRENIEIELNEVY